jgi:hypothetical protein
VAYLYTPPLEGSARTTSLYTDRKRYSINPTRSREIGANTPEVAAVIPAVSNATMYQIIILYKEPPKYINSWK